MRFADLRLAHKLGLILAAVATLMLAGPLLMLANERARTYAAQAGYTRTMVGQALSVMHPIKPELDGRDMSGFEDPHGIPIFREFVRLAAGGGGTLEYAWPKPGRDTPQPKIAYVEAYPPWGWIVGTGVYVDDVEATFPSVTTRCSRAGC